MNHYKSWSGLQKQLEDLLCAPLRGRITYFLTRYNSVHDAYGRASIRLDGRELACFSWDKEYAQHADTRDLALQTGTYNPDDPTLVAKWNEACTYSEWDFLKAATTFLSLPIDEALTLDTLPPWVKQFYELRLSL